MQEVYAAHQKFTTDFYDWWNKSPEKNKKPGERLEPESITRARDEFFLKHDALFGRKIEPLEKKFREDPNSAIDELMEFLAVDIPAFRCGYAKEVFLQELKKVELSAADAEKLKQIAIKYCETQNVRREFRRWCRLMVVFADERFVSRLEGNLESDNRCARFKSRWMLNLIKQQRVELRKTKNK